MALMSIKAIKLPIHFYATTILELFFIEGCVMVFWSADWSVERSEVQMPTRVEIGFKILLLLATSCKHIAEYTYCTL